MTSLKQVIELIERSRSWDSGSYARFDFWKEALGDRPLREITADEVDEAIAALALRGKLRPTRNGEAVATGKPYAPATLNRFITTLQSVYKYARKHRITPRAFQPPTIGIEKEPEPMDPNRYLRPEEVESLVAAARVLDTRWGKLEALIILGHHTGMRIGNLMALTWEDVDLEARTVIAGKTKNGDPQYAVLSESARDALAKLPRRHDLVFANKRGEPFHFRCLWNKVTKAVGLEGKNFHQLRHGCGHYLAVNGVNQAAIMAHLGHRTLSASARYLHANTEDKRRVVDRVFN
jgi:integrase